MATDKARHGRGSRKLVGPIFILTQEVEVRGSGTRLKTLKACPYCPSFSITSPNSTACYLGTKCLNA